MIANQNIAKNVITFELISNGKKVDENSYHVKNIGITKEVNRIASARITLYDGENSKEGFKLSDTDDFVPGNTIEITAGYHSKNETVFKGIIIKQCIKKTAGRFELIIDCKHAAVNMTIAEKCKYYYKATDSEIIEEFSQPYGIALEAEPTTVKHEEMVQYQVSDWEFMVMRAEANSQLIFTDDEGLKITTPDFTKAPTFLFDPDSILEIESEMDARTQLKSATSATWDPSTQQVITTEANTPEVNQQGNLETAILANVTEHETYEMWHSGNIKDLELQAWADAKLLKSHMAKIRGRIKYQGNASIQMGEIAELDGIGERFNGNIYITGIRHQINSSNWENGCSILALHQNGMPRLRLI